MATTSSFKNLKKSSSSTDKLTKALADSQNKKVDERFWQPEVDKAGNGYAVIRFLDSPEVDGDAGLPFVQYFAHGFQGPGGWYIENSLTTLGKDDPVSEWNSLLWNSGVEANKKQASAQKRKLNFVSNILVVTDAAHPEKEGKVFLFRYGKKIFDKIKEKLEPQFPDEPKVNPFNMWEGANFKLKIRNVEGYRNYDKSEFDAPSAVAKTDDEIEKIWKTEYSLKEFIDPSKFKTYDQLKARLDKVLGKAPEVNSSAATASLDQVSEGGTATPEVTTTETDDDGSLDMFKKLAED